MKKFIALLLALVMCIGLVACGNTNTPAPSQDPTTPPPSESVTPPPSQEPTPSVEPEPAPVAGDFVADAKSYVRAMYKDKAGKVLRDFDVVASVKIGEFTYDVTWTTDAAEENVKIGEPANNKITIDINEKPGEEDLVFTLTATVTADGKSESTTFEFYVPGTPAKADGPEFVDVPEVGATYKFALVQGELGKTLYFTGAMSGNYLATSENPGEAVDVTIEEVEGGVRFYFMDGETKMYIDINEYTEGKAGVRLTAEPTATFVWNEECGVYTAEVAGAPRYLGTYSTYNTMSASDIKYIAGENVSKIGISQFPAGFCTVTYEVKTIEGQPAAGTSALFYLTQAELGQTLYFTGAMSGNYLATTTDPTKGVNVTVEEVEGGYRLFFMDGATKTYIDIHEYTEGKAGIRLTTEPTAVFVWNEECGVFTAEVAGAPRYLGTYSTYNTISASDIKYIAGENVGKIGVSQFPAGFGFIVYDFVAAEGQPAADATYKFALTQGELGQTLFFAGFMSGNYLATTENGAAAADMTIEAVEGGFRFYFMDGETKTYIDIHEYTEGKAGIRLTTEPTAVFVWNEECGVFTAEVAGAPRYLGTYSTYNTMSASDIKYIAGENVGKIGISQFPAYFGTLSGSAPAAAPEKPAEPENPTEPEEPVVSTDPAADSTLTVADAIALGASKAHNAYTDGKYYVTGVITEVYNETYGNMKIADDAGNILTVYGTYGADGTVRYDALEVKPVAGDTVTVYGILGQYNDAPQMKNGWITAHTAAAVAPIDPDTPAEPEEPEDPATPALDPAADSTLTVADALALGASKEHNVYTEGKYYVTGVITEVYNEKYGNLEITDEAGNILTIYGTYNADGTVRYDALETKPVAGDTITVYGIIGQYSGTPQLKNGWITAHTPVAPATPAEPELTVTTAAGDVITVTDGIVTITTSGGSISGKGTVTEDFTVVTSFEGMVEEETAVLVTFASDAEISVKGPTGVEDTMAHINYLYRHDTLFVFSIEMGTLYAGPVAPSFESVDLFRVNIGLYATMEGKDVTSELPPPAPNAAYVGAWNVHGFSLDGTQGTFTGVVGQVFTFTENEVIYTISGANAGVWNYVAEETDNKNGSVKFTLSGPSDDVWFFADQADGSLLIYDAGLMCYYHCSKAN